MFSVFRSGDETYKNLALVNLVNLLPLAPRKFLEDRSCFWGRLWWGWEDGVECGQVTSRSKGSMLALVGSRFKLTSEQQNQVQGLLLLQLLFPPP